MSGISKAVIIVETLESRGAVWQAKFAIEQGRPLFILDTGEKKFRPGIEKLTSLGGIVIREKDIDNSLVKTIMNNGKKAPVSGDITDY